MKSKHCVICWIWDRKLFICHGSNSRIYDVQTQHLENTLDVEMKLREHGTIYVLYVYRKEWCKKILNYLYKDAELYLDRKYEIYQSKYI